MRRLFAAVLSRVMSILWRARKCLRRQRGRWSVAIWTSLRPLTLFAIRSGRMVELTPRAVRHLLAFTESDARPTVLLEIGANDGGHTLGFLNELGKAVTIHAFEPEPRAARRFAARGFDERVRLHEIALGSSDGCAQFFQSGGAVSEARPEGWFDSGSLRQPKRHLEVHPWVTFESSLEVSVRSLDSWAAEFGVESVDFIWMDVQGAEADVIRGGLRLLSNTRFLYTEYSDDELYEGQATLGQLVDLLDGWRLVAQFPNDVLFENARLGTGKGDR
jgi:FkbM family methyltransferase